MQLVHDTLIAPAEHNNKLLDLDGPMAVAGPRDRVVHSGNVGGASPSWDQISHGYVFFL